MHILTLTCRQHTFRPFAAQLAMNLELASASRHKLEAPIARHRHFCAERSVLCGDGHEFWYGKCGAVCRKRNVPALCISQRIRRENHFEFALLCVNHFWWFLSTVKAFQVVQRASILSSVVDLQMVSDWRLKKCSSKKVFL